MPLPLLNSTGTGGGFQIFCGGVGPGPSGHHGRLACHKEVRVRSLACRTVSTAVTEVLIGYDGLSIAHSQPAAPEISLTKAQIFQALAAEVEVDGQVVANPYKNWNEIDASLPRRADHRFRPPADLGYP